MQISSRAVTVKQALASAGIPRNEASMLLAFATGWPRTTLIAQDDRELPASVRHHFDELVFRRVAGEPIAYLIGRREFYGLDLTISPAVLIPRPETELLVDRALARIAEGAASVLDLGTGSGAIAIAIAKHAPNAAVTATDRSSAALEIARANAKRHDVAVRFCEGDWFQAVLGERFDVIVANPPYVAAGDAHLTSGDCRFEPIDALVGGATGLAALERIIAAACEHLEIGGTLHVEHGFDQAEAVAQLMTRAGLVDARGLRDLQGHLRVAEARRAG